MVESSEFWGTSLDQAKLDELRIKTTKWINAERLRLLKQKVLGAPRNSDTKDWGRIVGEYEKTFNAIENKQ
jgi:hypothetical protein